MESWPNHPKPRPELAMAFYEVTPKGDTNHNGNVISDPRIMFSSIWGLRELPLSSKTRVVNDPWGKTRLARVETKIAEKAKARNKDMCDLSNEKPKWSSVEDKRMFQTPRKVIDEKMGFEGSINSFSVDDVEETCDMTPTSPIWSSQKKVRLFKDGELEKKLVSLRKEISPAKKRTKRTTTTSTKWGTTQSNVVNNNSTRATRIPAGFSVRPSNKAQGRRPVCRGCNMEIEKTQMCIRYSILENKNHQWPTVHMLHGEVACLLKKFDGKELMKFLSTRFKEKAVRDLQEKLGSVLTPPQEEEKTKKTRNPDDH